jgi:hypothetical protein
MILSVDLWTILISLGDLAQMSFTSSIHFGDGTRHRVDIVSGGPPPFTLRTFCRCTFFTFLSVVALRSSSYTIAAASLWSWLQTSHGIGNGTSF